MAPRHICILLIALGSAAKAAPEGVRILRDEWRALADGATVFYSRAGAPAGREYFYPDENFSIFESPDGRCVEGPWAYSEGRFCFWYGENFQCFGYFREDGAIWSRADAGGSLLRVDRIETGDQLDCAP